MRKAATVSVIRNRHPTPPTSPDPAPQTPAQQANPYPQNAVRFQEKTTGEPNGKDLKAMLCRSEENNAVAKLLANGQPPPTHN